ncbi:MAG: hypothetical protein ACD_39C01795G0003 [uncultured bacterium]|nr:MAG: hypothetical protein ACD_39C01795G0003 [uncultured bacterium]
MKIFLVGLTVIFCAFGLCTFAAPIFESDVIVSANGEIKLTFIGHGTLLIEYAGKVIHIDPWTKLADYKQLPKADLVLITHEHADHTDAAAVAEIKKEATQIIYTEACAQSLPGGTIVKNGDVLEAFGMVIQALPAYNILHKRDNGEPFHPKGRGNAYLLTIDGRRILIGGDTENIEELKALKEIDVAFLPMNLPYTMTPEMVADIALAMRPRILYPYHFGETDTGKLVELLKDQKEIEVRIRNMK